mgnify:CR=1 FL=1
MDVVFFFESEDGIRDLVRSRGLGDVYKRQLRVRALAIGPEIDPGVPWTLAVGGEPYRLALKSGNFGARDFFAKATEMLQ